MYKANFLSWWEGKHMRQKHLRFYRPAICPPSLAEPQRATNIKRKTKDWILIDKKKKNQTNRKHSQVYKNASIFTFITVMIVLSGNANVLQTFPPIQAMYDSCHRNWYPVSNLQTYKAPFPWFPILWKALKGSISPSWFQEPKQGNICLLNKTWSLSPNPNLHGNLFNKQDSNLPLSL